MKTTKSPTKSGFYAWTWRRGIAVAIVSAGIVSVGWGMHTGSALRASDPPSATPVSQPDTNGGGPKQVVIPSPVEPAPFPETPFASDTVIPSKLAIQVVGWSPDSKRLAYASTDVSLNLPPGAEELYSSDLTGGDIVDEGVMSRPSLLAQNVYNPQVRPAAAWAPDGTLVRLTEKDAVYNVESTSGEKTPPTSALYSVQLDKNGQVYVMGNGVWQRFDGATVASIPGAIDEGSFSVSPDGGFVTFERNSAEGLRDLVLADSTGNEVVLATAAFVNVDGWKTDSSAVALRTGVNAGTRWGSTVVWFDLSTKQTTPLAEKLAGFQAQVVPNPSDPNVYLVGMVPFGAGTSSLAAWYMTTDAGASFTRFGLGAIGGAAGPQTG